MGGGGGEEGGEEGGGEGHVEGELVDGSERIGRIRSAFLTGPLISLFPLSFPTQVVPTQRVA